MMYVGVDVLVADVPMMQAGVDLVLCGVEQVYAVVLWGSRDLLTKDASLWCRGRNLNITMLNTNKVYWYYKLFVNKN